MNDDAELRRWIGSQLSRRQDVDSVGEIDDEEVLVTFENGKQFAIKVEEF